MRKRILPVLLCVLVLTGACTAVLSAGGADDPLISESWLYNTLMPRLWELLGQESSGAEKLAEEYEARLDGLSFAKGSDSDYAGMPTLLALREDDTVAMDEFGCFLLTEGTAKLRCNGCEVIDLYDGTVCADGSWLQAQHRYFAAKGGDAAILIYSDTKGYMDGYYLRETETVFPAADRYRDTEGHWAETSIRRMTELEAVNGIEKHSFAPDMKVSRAMFVAVLCRLFGTEDGRYVSVFDDVKDGDWYAPYINWAAANDLVIGYGDGSFGPDDLLTREQMAAILTRCCAKFGIRLPGSAANGAFSDAEKISDWARDAVELAQRSGLINGRETGEFDPTGSASRAEMCTVFCRLYDKAE